MRVLFQIRKDYLKFIAGDSIIFLNTRKNLIDLGVKVDICTDPTIQSLNYDLIHVFNTVRVNESFESVRNAKKQNKKVVLTPIYWDLKKFYKQTNQLSKLESWKRSEWKRKFIFENCDFVLPHAIGELELIKKNYSSSIKYAVIPYGTDISYMQGNKNFLKERYGIEECILCVGRISEQKNQLNLIKALKKENIPIILVGSINDREYYRECVQQGKSQVLVLDKIKTDQLKDIYKSAKVHILPSWVEYPGLATLEAGIAGCNVVTTELGSTREVFKDFVNYCNPEDIDSIYNHTMKAYESIHDSRFKNYIIEHYLWTKIAEEIKRVYYSIL